MPIETLRMTGGPELAAALAQFTTPTRRAVSRRALRKAADPILAAWKAGTKVLTGHLQESEVVGTKLNKRQTRMNRRNLGRSEVEVHIGTNDPAGVQEEFGNAHQRAAPSLRPAWDAEGGQKAVDRIGEELWIDIEATAARVARRASRAGG